MPIEETTHFRNTSFSPVQKYKKGGEFRNLFHSSLKLPNMVADISVSISSESLKNILNSDPSSGDKYSFYNASEDYCSETLDSGDESDLSLYSEDSDAELYSENDEDVNEPSKTLEQIQMEFDEMLNKFTKELDEFEEEMKDLKAVF